MKKIPLPPKYVIVSGLIAGIIGFVLFTALLMLNLNNDNTFLIIAQWVFLALHAFSIMLAIYRLKKLRDKKNKAKLHQV